MSAPKDIMKSRYWFPSASQTCEPLPRSKKSGPGEYTAFPRDGEFTPSTNDCCARSNHCWERVRVLDIRIICLSLFVSIRDASLQCCYAQNHGEIGSLRRLDLHHAYLSMRRLGRNVGALARSERSKSHASS